MKSVLSFPERGKWGSSSYRGNCSGHVQRELIEHFRPGLFVDVCEGSGTSGDVCRDLGVPYLGFDLATGTDFLRSSIRALLPKPADLVFSHPPYHDMIAYSGSQWGTNPAAGDLSHCSGLDEFLEKSQLMLLNQREAAAPGGVFCTLIGDYRKAGVFHSFQADFIRMLPRSELMSVTIKMQHNCVSDRKVYGGGGYIPIMHEYLILWRRSAKPVFSAVWDAAQSLKRLMAGSWRNAIRMALMELGGSGRLQDIYAGVEAVAGELITRNSHWREKIRQVLQRHFQQVQRGEWAVA